MTDKIALVTGAARGLGREIALALTARGDKVFLVDILADRLEATVAELRANGGDVEGLALDLSQRQACLDAVSACVARFGRLDVLVNCAAIMTMDHFTDVSEETWTRILAVNLSAPFYLCQAAIPHLIAAKGNIVNVASSNGLMGTAYTGPYSATKAALINLTKTLAVEFAEEPIRVNAICPGPMATEIATTAAPPPTIKREKIARYSGLRGLGDAGEVAQVAAFLASDQAAAVNGAIWTADLGTSAG